MKLILETTPELMIESVINEGVNDSKSWYISGVTLQSNIKNGNGRVYPKEVLQRAIQEHMKMIESNRSAGELGHPEKNAADVNLENVCMKFVSVVESGNDFITKAKVCSDLPKGKILEGLLREGFNLGISSRGLGNLKESNGAKVVSEYSIVTLGDIVYNPSAPNAFITGLMESKEWVWENGILVEKESVVEQKIDEWQETIKTAKKEDLQEAARKVFSDFIRTLKL